MKAIVSCNTAAGPYFVAATQSTSWNPLNIPQFVPFITANCSNTSQTLKCAMQQWWSVLEYLSLSLAAPINGGSSMMRGLQQQNVSSLRIFYNGTTIFVNHSDLK